uniref:ACB domain-containing protein n=1 Tax=Rhabditophanes sp. KR3021 TaxID=114890 RepID=A0AC35U5B1_9BILA
MASLEDRYQASVAIVQKLPNNGPLTTSNDQKLAFYALFKQASLGNVTTDRPGIFSFIERKKWDAWKEKEGMSADDAKEQYIETLLATFDNIQGINIGEWLSGPNLDPTIKENLALLGKVF